MTLSPPPAAGIQDAARHLASAQPAEAAAVLERLVADFPAYVTAYVLLAKAYEADGRVHDALEAWHHAYFLMPGSPLVLRERTRLLRTAPIAAAAPSAEPLSVEPVAPERATPEPEPEPESEREPEAESEPEEVLAEEVEETGTALPSAEAPPAASALEEADDLDTLIHQLENAPRIRPDPTFRGDGMDEEEDDEEGVVSETLARIYASQKEYAAAARAYDQLAELHPARAAEMHAQAAEMRRLAEMGP